ncbi:MAG: phosphoenolpyruvate--protein phosphotransferase [bacterium]
MSLEFTFTFPLPNGLHARPASLLRDEAVRFSCATVLHNGRNGLHANVKSLLSLVSADFRLGDPARLTMEGADEGLALPALEAFLRDEFPGCDSPLPEVAATRGVGFVPRLIAASGAAFYRGRPVSPGFAVGAVVVADMPGLPEGCPGLATDAVAEGVALEAAIAAVTGELHASMTSAKNTVEREVLKAHLAVAKDPEFAGKARDRIFKEGRSAAAAVQEIAQVYSEILRASESVYLRERVLDIKDVAGRLLRQLSGEPIVAGLTLEAPAVVMATLLTPSEFLALDRRFLRGLVLSEGGTTSHTVILARAFGIPCVSGVKELHGVLKPGITVLVDARRGLVIPEPPATVRRYYDLDERRYAERAGRVAGFAAKTGATADGRRIEIAANVSSAAEAEAAFGKGAEGIGLFRTEMLFMDRPAAPSEEEQVAEYRRAVTVAGSRPVIIRSLDIGGDKPLPYLNLPKEDNPFLGCRAVRFYGAHKPMIKTQFRAILRAATDGNVKLMVPMIGHVDEVRVVKALMEEARAELVAEQLAFNPDVALGVMLEVPSAAFAIPELAREVSFFSIGTNDLAQYFFAMDRGNPAVADGMDPLNSSFLRLLKKITDDAHAAGRPVGLCGEIAGRPDLAPLLVGLGLDELSMAAPLMSGMKAAIHGLKASDCDRIVAQSLLKPDAAEVRALLRETAATVSGDMLHPELIMLESEAASRGEVIKELTDRLWLAGRVGDADVVEEALWRREDTYSTGMGFGVAVPHCKSPEVIVNSVAVLKMKTPIVWNPSDSAPVGLVILLAMRDINGADTHMAVFSKLARKLMHEEFRDRLRDESDVKALTVFIRESLNV